MRRPATKRIHFIGKSNASGVTLPVNNTSATIEIILIVTSDDTLPYLQPIVSSFGHNQNHL